jgi:drug/metabolite transporter (DMT)-like permease
MNRIRAHLANSNVLVGGLIMLLAMASLSFGDSLGKYLVAYYPSEQVVFFRAAVHASMVLPIVLYFHGWTEIRRELKRDQIIRAACFAGMSLCYFAGLRYTPLAEGMATVFLFPCLILIGSALFLGEKVGLGRWVAAVFGLLGVTIVAGATFEDAGWGLLWIIAAAVFTAAYGFITKQVSGRGPVLVMGLLPALLGSAIVVLPAAWMWVMPSFEALLVMILVGVFSGTGHMLIVVAYSKAEASFIAPLAYTQLISGIFYGYLIFNDIPTFTAWIGMTVIITSGVFMALYERRKPTGATGRR